MTERVSEDSPSSMQVSKTRRFTRIVPLKVPRKLLREFSEPRSQFPDNLGDSIRFIGGRTLSRFGNYHKAAILVQTTGGLQIRFYGWRFTRKKTWWAQQKFYVSPGTIPKVIEVLDAFLINSPKARPKSAEDT